MIIENLADTAGVEIPALQRFWLQQYQHQVFQFMAHPVNDRQRETPLGTVKDVFRHAHAFCEFAKDIFQFLATRLPVRRQGRNPLDEHMVQNRYAHFERRQHAHAIDFGEDVPGKIGLGVDVKGLTYRVAGRSLLKIAQHDLTGIALALCRHAKFIAQQFGLSFKTRNE